LALGGFLRRDVVGRRLLLREAAGMGGVVRLTHNTSRSPGLAGGIDISDRGGAETEERKRVA
jgi:hypothetical protein